MNESTRTFRVSRTAHVRAIPATLTISVLTAVLTAMLFGFGLAKTASATSLPLHAISLEDLLDSSGKFTSTDGALVFESFSANSSGELSDSDLDDIFLVPLIDGFRLAVEPDEFLPSEAELILSYSVKTVSSSDPYAALPGTLIESMSLGVLGTSLLDDPFTAEMEAFAGHNWGYSANAIGNVQVSGDPGDEPFASTSFTSPSSSIRVIARLITVEIDDDDDHGHHHGRHGRHGGRGGHGRRGHSDDDNRGKDRHGRHGGHDHDDDYYDYDNHYDNHYGHHDTPLDGGTEMRFTAQPIPEPSSALLLGLGLIGFCVRSRSVSQRRGNRL